jgi:hypothetical protein
MSDLRENGPGLLWQVWQEENLGTVTVGRSPGALWPQAAVTGHLNLT